MKIYYSSNFNFFLKKPYYKFFICVQKLIIYLREVRIAKYNSIR